MKWITREKAKVDRIACPWLIRNFVDKDAEFLFVPKESVMETARKEDAIPFDTPGAELFHFSEKGIEYDSFDAIIRKYGINDKALDELARIVRGADTRMEDTPHESPGLEAAALGFREISGDDHENMRLQFPYYDAMYAYCKGKLSGKIKLEH